MVMIGPIDVNLNELEMARSIDVAKRRDVASAGFTQGHGYKGNTLVPDLIGAAGEAAFCKAFGLYWSGDVNTFKLPDARHNIQIRTAPCRAPKPPQGFGTLIVRHDDDDRDYFALVVGNAPYFRVMGWIRGADAKQDFWLKSEARRPPAWFVPNCELTKDFSPLFERGW